MKQSKLHKKLFAFGISLILLTVPILILLEVDYAAFLKHFFVLDSDTSLLHSLTLIGYVLILGAFVVRKLTK